MALWDFFVFERVAIYILIMIRKPEIKERNKQITGDNMHCMHSTCNSRWFSTYVHDHQFWPALSLSMDEYESSKWEKEQTIKHNII
jgi:hypothetical protein